ncbi:uncharacterized protein LOC110430409 [Sorghum bicolor]|uniref:uncharacterized protein LOC110430409 n=1 Tax=Sorghum bicolor TaxID=4558 RepID=UPI000B424160|nr:uncharacterized protein LOC110430409 [Sorghum bicolor]|eukprot:XP_021303751.1 uncharacterized protein LOC110430409 [Sorghum bicolor]
MLHRLHADFYVPGDHTLFQDWVRAYSTCQRNKTETLQPARLLQPLDVPSQVWVDISMDFIEGLPKVGGKSVILTVVDCFSKYVHFIALGHPYTAASVARAFFDGIVRLHGFPSSIVSDRDPVFTEHVWHDLFKMAQQLSKCYYDASHWDVEFAVGDWVWFRLLNRTTKSLEPHTKGKLGPRYAGPFRVLERISQVVYLLKLPEGAHGRRLPKPEQALQAKQRCGASHVLVKWRGLPEADVTWELLDVLRDSYPDFQLEDELFAQAGRDAMTGVQYQRCRPISG